MTTAHLTPDGVLVDDVRDRPNASFIQQVRERFPTEVELDRILTIKMHKRHQPPVKDFSLASLQECLQRFLEDRLPTSFAVFNCRWLSGGASKLQMAFTLDWDDPRCGRTTTEMVVRMEPAESLNATSRTREFQLLAAFEGTLPVPRVFWLDESERFFPEAAIVYEFAHGVTKPTGAGGRVSGLGQAFPAEVRRHLAPQFIEHLARIHTFDPSGSDMSSFEVPEVGSPRSALLQLGRARRVWEEDRGHAMPLFDVASNWLERNAPNLDAPTVLHGDYRAGNFLFDEESLTITSWLDWERGYIGDRHRDLAWTTTSTFGNYAEDGTTFLVSGLVPLEEFYAGYEAASGLSVDLQRIRYYRVLNSFQLMVSALATAYRLVRLGKTHQDVLLAWVEGVGYAQAEELRAAIGTGD